MIEIITKLESLYKDLTGSYPLGIKPVGHSGSERKYFRLSGSGGNIIGVYNDNIPENQAFHYLTRHFASHELPVPDILAVDKDEKIYLLADLGDVSLFSLISNSDDSGSIHQDVIHHFMNALEILPRFQIMAAKGLDFGRCYPVSSFDSRSIFWDLNYFKYCFLKPAKISFNEFKLENDFHALARFLTEKSHNYFMYRDFQSRNIMIKNDRLYFIDYQGGRKGPLQYDVISLLFQVRAGIPADTRRMLLDHYLKQIENFIRHGKSGFARHFPGYLYLRLLQVFGAYGFRGLIERKSHFILSIPYAVKMLREIREEYLLPFDLPELENIFESISQEYQVQAGKIEGLTVTIYSFSYKNGIPPDNSGHGGGFVFDCRALPNPGRDKNLRDFTGRDDIIVEYLEGSPEVNTFLKNLTGIIDNSVSNYLGRKFSNLQISFGCTGGQHRSVFCAEKLAGHIKQKFSVIVNLKHRELNIQQEL